MTLWSTKCQEEIWKCSLPHTLWVAGSKPWFVFHQNMCESESQSLSLDKISLKIKTILALFNFVVGAFWLQARAVFWTISLCYLAIRLTSPSPARRKGCLSTCSGFQAQNQRQTPCVKQGTDHSQPQRFPRQLTLSREQFWRHSLCAEGSVWSWFHP